MYPPREQIVATLTLKGWVPYRSALLDITIYQLIHIESRRIAVLTGIGCNLFWHISPPPGHWRATEWNRLPVPGLYAAYDKILEDDHANP